MVLPGVAAHSQERYTGFEQLHIPADDQTPYVHVAKAALGVAQAYYRDDNTQVLLH